MAKFVSGIKRKKTNFEKNADGSALSRAAAAMLLTGAVSVSVILSVFLVDAGADGATTGDEYAVEVFGGTIHDSGEDGAETEREREELLLPSAVQEEKWNLYDYIGELFAGLISDR